MEANDTRKGYTLYDKRKAVEKANEVGIREASRLLGIPRKIFSDGASKRKHSNRLPLLQELTFGRIDGSDSQTLNIHYLNLLYWTTSKKREVNVTLSLVSRYVEKRWFYFQLCIQAIMSVFLLLADGCVE